MNSVLKIVADVVSKNAIAGAASVKGPASCLLYTSDAADD